MSEYRSIDSTNPFSHISEARRRAEELTREEENAGDIKKEVWQSYKGSLRDYEDSFDVILSAMGIRSFSRYINERQQEGRNIYIIDIMSDGEFLRQLPGIGGGLAVSLSDKRTPEMIEKDKAKNIDVIVGDILLPKTWQKISQWLKERGISFCDVAVCRGVGGVEVIPKEAYTYVLSQMWSRLSPADGLLLTQVPERDETLARQWGEEVKQTGIEFYFQRRGPTFVDNVRGTNKPAIGLIKKQGSPEKLPFLRDKSP